jgi:uncharacterized membrane protein YkoI
MAYASGRRAPECRPLTLIRPNQARSIAILASLVFAVLMLGTVKAQVLEPGVDDDSLSHAVQVLERNTGGKVLEVRVSDQPGELSLDAAIVKGGELIYMHTTANDKVTQIEMKKLPHWMVGKTLTAYMKSIDQAKLPLSEAIKIAEHNAKKPAIGAGLAAPLSGSNAVLAYNVEVLKGHKRERIAIDAVTGAPIANPDAIYEPWTPVDLARRIGI